MSGAAQVTNSRSAHINDLTPQLGSVVLWSWSRGWTFTTSPWCAGCGALPARPRYSLLSRFGHSMARMPVAAQLNHNDIGGEYSHLSLSVPRSNSPAFLLPANMTMMNHQQLVV